MKRNQIALLLGAVLIVMVMGSCDSLFTNQFQTWRLGQVSKDSLVAAANSGDVATLIAESGLNSGEGVSPSFLAAATVDQTTANEIIAALETAATAPGAAPETVQAAEALIIEIQLEVSGGKEFVDNIVTAWSDIDFTSLDISQPSSLASLISALFPARGARTLPNGWTEADIAAIINGILAVNGNLESLAGTLTSNQNYLVSGIDAAWLAQVGVIVAVLQEIDYVTPNYDNLGDALAYLMADSDPVANYASYISVDSANFLSDIQENQTLQGLFTAAGLDLNQIILTFGA